MMRTYELTYITKPDLDDRTLLALTERVNGMVTADGGSVIKVDRWGLRPLSYPIRKYREGHYIFALLALPADAPARLEQRLRLTEDVIRYLLVRADEADQTSDSSSPSAEAIKQDISPVPVEDAPSVIEEPPAVVEGPSAAPIDEPSEA
jgi:small subunit ribosomal protein S6